VRSFGGEFIGGEFLGGGEGVGGGNFYVGLDAGSFPVGLGDGVDGAGKRRASFIKWPSMLCPETG
jgi:hypothetical protein